MSREDYGECQFCGDLVLGWHATDGFHPSTHVCEPMVHQLHIERDEWQRRAESAEATVHRLARTELSAMRESLNDISARNHQLRTERDEWQCRAEKATVKSTTNTNERTEREGRLKATRFPAEVELRDYFAAAALTGLLSDGGTIRAYVEATGQDDDGTKAAKLLVKGCYGYADAMLTAREEADHNVNANERRHEDMSTRGDTKTGTDMCQEET